MAGISRRTLLSSVATALVVGVVPNSFAAPAPNMKVYKSPWCGCCGAWVEHVQQHGFVVEVVELEDVSPVKDHYGIRPQLQSCHTAVVDGYIVEGHVPAADIKRLLEERPSATGLTVPGMPIGSPGMEQGHHKDPYAVLLFSDTSIKVFSEYR